MNDRRAIVQTLDFFAPIVDDPYQYGAIAAANAMNDVYAMGGDVLLALNIAAFPEDLPLSVVAAILEGGADKVSEAGGVIAGGHTIIDAEPKYGLCVTGLVEPARVRTNASAETGDVVLLTKPIGTGVLITAIRERSASASHQAAAVEQMMTLDKTAAEVTRDFDVHAMTDVSGFGMAGHLYEIATNSGKRIDLSLSALPTLEGLAQYVARGFQTGGQQRNREYFGAHVTADGELTAYEETLLYDPQTSGGLLVTLAESPAEQLALRLAEAGVENWRIATVREGAGIRLTE